MKTTKFGFHTYDDEFYLPHQCDEWWIGGEKDMEAFIEEAKEILTKLRSK